MAVAASTFKPPISLKLRYEIEMRHRPSIHDNIKHWQVFEDDEQIKQFLSMTEDFEDHQIDLESDEDELADETLKKKIGGQEIIQLKDNVLPRGLVPLEILFGANDVAVNQKKMNQDEQVEDCNLGTQLEPKMVKLFKGIPKEYKERYIELFKQFKDVFSWSYDDLKTYDRSIIQHKIPLKDGVKSHK